MADQIMTANFVWHGGSAGELRGLEAFKQMLPQFFNAFPDLRATVDDIFGEEDRVVARFTVHGTHTGNLMGIAATGRQVTWTGINIYRIAGGKIAEEWFNEDTLGMMQQLGAIPTPGQAG